MKNKIRFGLLVCGWLALCCTSRAATLTWTNTLGGSWTSPANWSPNIVPGAGDTAYLTNSGTYSVIVTNPNPVTLANLYLGGSSGTQTLVVDNAVQLNPTNNWQVRANGVLVGTNSWFQGTLNVQPGGQLQLVGPATKFLYNTTVLNQGTVLWSGGSLEFGSTVISNGGLWQLTSDDTINYGGGNIPAWNNSGTLRKTAGTGTSLLGSLNFSNQPGGLVDAQSGTLYFYGGNSAFVGTFNATAPAQINFAGGTGTDGGGGATGSGTVLFSGTLNLRTNTVPGLQVTGGSIYLDPTNFQQAGAITNMTLNGATLHGTNRIAGTLTVNSGSLADQLTVQPPGQLQLAGSGLPKYLYGLTLLNQGTVTWSGGPLELGTTIISNGGLWQITGNDATAYGGGNIPVWTNSGVLRKTASTGTSGLFGVSIINQAGGVIQADSGTLQLPQNYTNTAGTLELNGGTIQAVSTPLTLAGGTLDGNGTLGANLLSGGTISPGFSPGLIQFNAGLNFGPGATLVIEGTGTTPGTGYDQLSVTGPVAISNCTLQVTSLPTVPYGTTFIIIKNTTGNPVQGTFANLPENSVLSVSGQSFHLHYAGGAGNDVTLVNATGAPASPQLANGGYASGAFHLLGTGSSSIVYGVQATTNFLQWASIGAATGDSGGNFNFVDTNASKFRYRFYRTTN